jgi:tRNA modification GTPase
MHWDTERTIAAVSSPLAPAQRAIVRLSGSRTRQVLEGVLAVKDSLPNSVSHDLADASTLDRLFKSQENVYCRAAIDLQWDGRLLESGVYYWPTSRSFTGQPSAELHFVGCLPLARRVLQRLIAQGAHPAERGEFALRSFLAGKIDLVQAEGLLGVIESAVGNQLHWALEQMSGNLSRPVRDVRRELVELLADLEAGLDFVDEDIQFITDEQAIARLEGLSERVSDLLRQLDFRGTPNRPLEIALLGAPNAGKSSLFNALLGTDRTIVSPQSGTTRDTITSILRIEGLDSVRISLMDTAGIESADEDSPRGLAQRFLPDRVHRCDLILWCVDLSVPLSAAVEPAEWQQRLGDSEGLIRIGTKADLCGDADESHSVALAVSIHRPESIIALKALLCDFLQSLTDQRFTQATHHTAVRCRHGLEKANSSFSRAGSLLLNKAGHELVASELQCALHDLSSIIGEVHSDDILGEIFNRFCIGK